MASNKKLLKRIRELEEENDELRDRLDRAVDVLAPPEEEDEDEARRRGPFGGTVTSLACGGAWRKLRSHITDRAAR